MECISKLPLMVKFCNSKELSKKKSMPIIYLTQNKKYQADINKKYFVKPISKIIDYNEFTLK